VRKNISAPRYRIASEEKSSTNWMLTFADLLSLILTFFVLIYAMSALEGSKFREISASLSQKLNPTFKVEEETPAADKGIKRIDVPVAINLDYLTAIITDKFKDSKKLRSAFTIRNEEDKIIISLVGAIAFDEGKSDLTQEGTQALFFIGGILQTIGNHIDVFGSLADDGDSAANWELSLNRAVVVSQALRNMGYAYKITSFGQAPVTFVGEKSEAASRHVDIVIRSNSAEL